MRVELGRSEDQGHSQLHSEFKVSLGYMRGLKTVSKQINKQNNVRGWGDGSVDACCANIRTRAKPLGSFTALRTGRQRSQDPRGARTSQASQTQ